jgi:hypothetical protein
MDLNIRQGSRKVILQIVKKYFEAAGSGYAALSKVLLKRLLFVLDALLEQDELISSRPW